MAVVSWSLGTSVLRVRDCDNEAVSPRAPDPTRFLVVVRVSIDQKGHVCGERRALFGVRVVETAADGPEDVHRGSTIARSLHSSAAVLRGTGCSSTSLH